MPPGGSLHQRQTAQQGELVSTLDPDSKTPISVGDRPFHNRLETRTKEFTEYARTLVKGNQAIRNESEDF